METGLTPPASSFEEPDESRPAKRVRFDAPLDITEDLCEEAASDGDWDDLYDSPAYEQSDPATKVTGTTAEPTVPFPADAEETLRTSTDTEVPQQDGATDDLHTVSTPTQDAASPRMSLEAVKTAEEGLPKDALDHGNELVGPQPKLDGLDNASAKIIEEVSSVGVDTQSAPTKDGETVADEQPESLPPNAVAPESSGHDNSQYHGEPSILESVIYEAANRKPDIKATEDAEFMAAAAAQEDDGKAEWRFDPSDAESSSDSSDSIASTSSSDSDSDPDSDAGYEMLDPATAAKILMQGEGDDYADGNNNDKGEGDRQPRTANEVKEEVEAIPNIDINDDTKITMLGHVDSKAGNVLIIKALTSGEYQVLESGSVLCNNQREVIGTVAETIGRVQQPFYTMVFNANQELEQLGLEFGSNVFYVDEHSTFVFTQPLRGLKGTDASNIHDEEVGDDEIEFSDDEKEAEYKRLKKQAKRAAQGGGLGTRGQGTHTNGQRGAATAYNGGTAFVHGGGNDTPQESYGSGIKYDDDDDDNGNDDGFYKRLRRPENFSQIMAGAPPAQNRVRGGTDLGGRGGGRGEYSGRGRGDSGRGRGAFRSGGRSRRGGRGNHHGQHQGAEHGNDASQQSRPSPAMTIPMPHPQHDPTHPQYHPPSQQQVPQTYQFNGYTFQYGTQPPPTQQPYTNQPPQHLHPYQQTPALNQLSAANYANPYFQQGQQLQSPAVQHQNWQGYGQWPPPHDQSVPPTNQPDLATIMRNLQGSQGR